MVVGMQSILLIDSCGLIGIGDVRVVVAVLCFFNLGGVEYA